MNNITQQRYAASVGRPGATSGPFARYDVKRTFQIITPPPPLSQMESASHAICYRETDSGILIVRVLLERMDFTRHL